MLIYIICPYSGKTPAETFSNVISAVKAAEWIWERGHTPIIPHLSWVVEQLSDKFDWRSYIQWSLELLLSAHAVFLVREDQSKGVQFELQTARELGLPIFTAPSQIPIDCLRVAKRAELTIPEYVKFVIRKRMIENIKLLERLKYDL